MRSLFTILALSLVAFAYISAFGQCRSLDAAKMKVDKKPPEGWSVRESYNIKFLLPNAYTGETKQASDGPYIRWSTPDVILDIFRGSKVPPVIAGRKLPDFKAMESSKHGTLYENLSFTVPSQPMPYIRVLFIYADGAAKQDVVGLFFNAKSQDDLCIGDIILNSVKVEHRK